MKKILLILLSFLYINICAQSLVDTVQHNKNVILEEFTGIHCGFCPDGHVIAQTIHSIFPLRVFLINVHTGSYAQPSVGEPDFRTPFGSALSSQSNLNGYPAGTVNRHRFSFSQNGGTALSRNDWQSATYDILSQLSPVNVASTAQYDTVTNELFIDVEIYYTDSQNVLYNYLNVAITQDSIIGPQSGAQTWNPNGIVPGPWQPTYSHQHMLRHFVTGQSGQILDSIIPGNFIHKRFTWQVPYDINDIPVVIKDLNVVCFVTDQSQEILSGIETPVTILPQVVSSIREIIPTKNDNIIYDIFGRTVKQTKKGIVHIKNTKKFIKF